MAPTRRSTCHRSWPRPDIRAAPQPVGLVAPGARVRAATTTVARAARGARAQVAGAAVVGVVGVDRVASGPMVSPRRDHRAVAVDREARRPAVPEGGRTVAPAGTARPLAGCRPPTGLQQAQAAVEEVTTARPRPLAGWVATTVAVVAAVARRSGLRVSGALGKTA